VRATELDFERFVGDQSAGEYQAALLLLAINIGFPAVGGQLLRLLCHPEKTGSWEHFLLQLDPASEVTREPWARSVRWSPEQKKDLAKVRELVAALNRRAEDTTRDFLVPESLEDYVTWAPEVGRYSFHWNISDRDWESPTRQRRSATQKT
jgi:hypothetical protein